MANERFSSALTNEDPTSGPEVRSLRGVLIAALLLTALGVLLVMAFFLLLASAQ